MRSNVEAAQSAWNARTPSAGRSGLAGTNFVPWLRGLAEKGGKGVVNNIDARCLGRIADEIERLQADRQELAQENDTLVRTVVLLRAEIDRLQEAKRRALEVADRRAKEVNELREHGKD